MHYQYPIRINLKTNTDYRDELIDFCLHGGKQYVAVGWSYVYENGAEITDYRSYYDAVRASGTRMNHALNLFRYAEEGDLFWTRDLDGCYWICRAEGRALALPEAGINLGSVGDGNRLDVGAVIPVKAYRHGLTVPGAVKASFNRPRGGIAEEIRAELMPEFSQYIYNKLSQTRTYQLPLDELRERSADNLIDNLPDFELEELVISYIQVRCNCYLLSNSIANRSTTIKIEGEFRSRDISHPGKAVVQVKGPKFDGVLRGADFKDYLDSGYTVFLYADQHCDDCGLKDVKVIRKQDLEDFYRTHRSILPESITDMENLFGK